MGDSAAEPINSVFSTTTQSNSLAASPTFEKNPQTQTPQYDEAKLLQMFKDMKRESTEYRWIWEREWLRDLFYVVNRQWIYYNPTRREWVDKRLQKWIPRPVTNKMAETVQAIRTNLAAVSLEVTCRPVGHDTESIAAAEIADQMSPMIHEEHLMDQTMREADFWLITTGNACLQVSWDKDMRSNRTFIAHERCLSCAGDFNPLEIQQQGGKCPVCQGNTFIPSTNPDGSPGGEYISFGRGKTTSLSPFEYAFPLNVTAFEDLPYIIRLRWRDKHWFEANHPELLDKITWEKSPTDRSLQIFKSLALTNDVGVGTQYAYLGTAGAHTVDGVTEYELWVKPTKEYPKGLVMRVLGDQAPILLNLPEEGIPGPFPYADIEGNPLFPFVHSQYEHFGGRMYGRSALSPLIQKQDQLNQLDSLIQLIVQRMANPVWVIPEGAGIEHFSGEPGLVLKWNPLAVSGQGKPERIGGVEVPGTLYELREQILNDIEQLSGTFDIIKGQKPTGVEAFSALQLLVERSQSRFTSVFQSRGEMYRSWFSLAIELERQFGPQQRTFSIIEPNRGFTFRHFENAQLQGQIAIMIEDGSTMPKTALGKRAAIEQANQLGLLNVQDPDQKYALLENFGLAEIAPALNIHVQAALQMQDAFEEWTKNPSTPMPLTVKPWFDPHIHWSERIKWLNTDRMREMLQKNQMFEQIVTAHLQQLQILMMGPMPITPEGVMAAPPMPAAPMGAPGAMPGGPVPVGGPLPAQPQPKPGGGGGQSMKNANKAGGHQSVPRGNGMIPNAGPQMGPS